MKDLSLHILDIVQNSIRAKASLIRIELAELTAENLLTITISDNGTGMSEEQLQRSTDPFYTSRTTRKVGLGLSLFKQNAEMAGGSFTISSAVGAGTKVVASFQLDHFDRPMLGDLTGTLLLLICSPEAPDYVFKHQTSTGEFLLDTREIRQTLDGVSITNPDVRAFLKEYIARHLDQIQISI